MSSIDPAVSSITEKYSEMIYTADPSVPAITKNIRKKEEGSGNTTQRCVLRTDALLKYILETSVYPREHKALQRLRKNTEENHARSIIATTPDEGQFLGLLLKLINAKNTIELGVFTGYSLLCTALALPDDGKVIALDINRDAYNMGVPYIEEAGVAHKIDFREGPAMDSVKALVAEEKNHGFFDFIFVDCDKNNYMNYHPLLLKLVKMGGLIGYDNTLWGGTVADDDVEDIPEIYLHYKPFVLELNTFLAADPRIEISHLSISDGLTLCRKIA